MLSYLEWTISKMIEFASIGNVDMMYFNSVGCKIEGILEDVQVN